jgi:hypothetical protein
MDVRGLRGDLCEEEGLATHSAKCILQQIRELRISVWYMHGAAALAQGIKDVRKRR